MLYECRYCVQISPKIEGIHTQKKFIYYILIYKWAKYFTQTWLWHKTGCHVLSSVLNADTKVSYFKVAWSSDFIQTVLLYLISILYLFITVFGRPKEELVIQNTSHTLLEATNIATHLTKAPLGKLHTCKQIAADWIWLSIKLAWWQRIKL